MVNTDTPVVNALKRAAYILNRAHVPYALTGSYAVWSRGGATLSTHDGDFLILQEDADHVLELFAAEGYQTVVPPEGWLVKAYDQDCDPPCLLDFIFVSSAGPVTSDMLADSDQMRVFSVPMPVASANTLMIHKLMSFGVHSCDFSQALVMARVLSSQVDWDFIRQQTVSSVFARTFLYLTDQLGVTTQTDVS